MSQDYEALCPGCFVVPRSQGACPRCGYDVEQTPSPLAMPPGTLLQQQYGIGRVLGRPGGFGITYLAWDTYLQRRVAIKEYLPRELSGRGSDQVSVVPFTGEAQASFRFGLDKFIEEARTLARFDHPNIVRVQTFFEANGTGYLVMDYYEGMTLHAYLAQAGGRLRPEVAVPLIVAVLEGLRVVHGVGLLHRDIDPQNIYLTTEGRAILLDFGAARTAMGERSKSLSVILKPGFAPYEQYQTRGNQGPWTDVYACAATLYRMVTGVAPPESVGRIVADNLRPPDAVVPELPPRLSAVILRGMAVRPTDRPQTAEAFQAMLLVKDPALQAAPAAPEASVSLPVPVLPDAAGAAAPPATANHMSTHRPTAQRTGRTLSHRPSSVAWSSRAITAPGVTRVQKRHLPGWVWGVGAFLLVVGGYALILGLTGQMAGTVPPAEAANEAPLVREDAAVTRPGAAVRIAVLANDSDPEAESLVLLWLGTARGGAVAANEDGSVTYTPRPDFIGEDVFTYSAGDGRTSSTGRVRVRVTAE